MTRIDAGRVTPFGNPAVAIVTVPRPLQEQLREAATESPVGILEQLEASREQQRETHEDQSLRAPGRAVSPSRSRVRGSLVRRDRKIAQFRAETQAGFNRLQDFSVATKTTMECYGGEISICPLLLRQAQRLL